MIANLKQRGFILIECVKPANGVKVGRLCYPISTRNCPGQLFTKHIVQAFGKGYVLRLQAVQRLPFSLLGHQRTVQGARNEAQRIYDGARCEAGVLFAPQSIALLSQLLHSTFCTGHTNAALPSSHKVIGAAHLMTPFFSFADGKRNTQCSEIAIDDGPLRMTSENDSFVPPLYECCTITLRKAR